MEKEFLKCPSHQQLKPLVETEEFIKKKEEARKNKKGNQ
jgi:hypothetical protein